MDVKRSIELSPEAMTAWIRARAEIPEIPASKNVEVKKEGRFLYDYRYAPLPEILSTVTPVLAKHGIGITQPVYYVDGILSLETHLIFSTGESYLAACEQVHQNISDLKAMGQTISYLRRYSLMSCLGIAPDEDMDIPEVNSSPVSPQSSGDKPNKPKPSTGTKIASASQLRAERDRPPESHQNDQGQALIYPSKAASIWKTAQSNGWDRESFQLVMVANTGCTSLRKLPEEHRAEVEAIANRKPRDYDPETGALIEAAPWDEPESVAT